MTCFEHGMRTDDARSVRPGPGRIRVKDGFSPVVARPAGYDDTRRSPLALGRRALLETLAPVRFRILGGSEALELASVCPIPDDGPPISRVGHDLARMRS